MVAFDLDRSFTRAAGRLASAGARRRRDRGRPRLPDEVVARLEVLLQGHQRPPVREILGELEDFCSSRGLETPARATIYQAMKRFPASDYAIEDLPPPVRSTLYNLADSGRVPGHQLAFHCLNYGGDEALSFAAGLPWLALYQAARLPGWRPRSRGLLRAILRARGIE